MHLLKVSTRVMNFRKKSKHIIAVCILFLNSMGLFGQPQKSTSAAMYFLNTGTFFSPAMDNVYFSPALDVEFGSWKTNRKNFFSWGASTEAWYFTSIDYGLNRPVVKNNTVGFFNVNGMFFCDNKAITPYLSPTIALATDFKNIGFAGGIALGLNHKTAKRLETFAQWKSIRFSRQLDYLDMYFFMVGLSWRLSD